MSTLPRRTSALRNAAPRRPGRPGRPRRRPAPLRCSRPTSTRPRAASRRRLAAGRARPRCCRRPPAGRRRTPSCRPASRPRPCRRRRRAPAPGASRRCRRRCRGPRTRRCRVPAARATSAGRVLRDEVGGVDDADERALAPQGERARERHRRRAQAGDRLGGGALDPVRGAGAGQHEHAPQLARDRALAPSVSRASGRAARSPRRPPRSRCPSARAAAATGG
jgi:hypothetical protein